MKKKDAGELLAGISNEKDALERCVADLKKEIDEYRKRELSISDSLTYAFTQREQIIKEAERKANSITDAAERKAAEISSSAKRQADELIGEATERAHQILEDAKKKSSDCICDANSYAENSKAMLTRISSSVEQAAVSLFEHIMKFRDLFEETTGLKLNLPVDMKEQTQKSASALPDEYETPAACYHAIKDIARNESEGVNLVAKKSDTQVNTAALQSDNIDNFEASKKDFSQEIFDEFFDNNENTDVSDINNAVKLTPEEIKKTLTGSVEEENKQNDNNKINEKKRAYSVDSINDMFSNIFGSSNKDSKTEKCACDKQNEIMPEKSPDEQSDASEEIYQSSKIGCDVPVDFDSNCDNSSDGTKFDINADNWSFPLTIDDEKN